MRIKRGQGSLEYLLIVALMIIIVAIGVRYLKSAAREIPHEVVLTVSNEVFTKSGTSDDLGCYCAYVIYNSSNNKYRVWYWFCPNDPSRIKKVQVFWTSYNSNVANLITEHTGNPNCYCSSSHKCYEDPPCRDKDCYCNYWEWVDDKDLPGQVAFLVWEK